MSYIYETELKQFLKEYMKLLMMKGSERGADCYFSDKEHSGFSGVLLLLSWANLKD